MTFGYDKDEIKYSLDIEQVRDLVAELGGEPQIHDDIIWCKTICHGGDSMKLWYYSNTHLFHCYTECSESFDIFELVRKVKSREQGKDYQLPYAVDFVARYFGFSKTKVEEDEMPSAILQYLTNLKKYEIIKETEIQQQIVDMKIIEDNFLNNFPQPIIQPWLDEGITKEVMDYAEIRYDPKNIGIIIPHFNAAGQLIGIRERTLVKENEIYGKYRPAKIAGTLYNHPLGLNLYGLNWAKNSIAATHKAIVVEAEKSVLKYMSYFGIESNICVATCGSNLTSYQVKLLMDAGAKEIIIAFDREGENDDKEKYVKKFYNIYKKFGNFINISFIYDKQEEILDYKDSPLDKGKNIFLKLFKERITLY